MTTVFISGSMQIKNLDSNVKKRLDNIIVNEMNIILGDADGVDSSIQSYLLEKNAKSVIIYCSGHSVRNNLGKWEIKNILTSSPEGTRAFYTAKDLALAKDADYGLMIWDTKSTGTLSNVIELLSHKKKSVVYINKAKEFVNVSEVKDLEKVVGFMSESALAKADLKIGLLKKIDSLRHQQLSFF